MDTYRTIQQNGQHELIIKKSRFIGQLIRIENEEDARAAIQSIRKEHWKATHHCFAYTLGKKQEIQRSSDDGEPSGTAGLPILEVLKKQSLVNTLAVVTRYFGGTKLGSGGLIRAYSQTTSQAIQAVGIVEGRLQQEISLLIDYPQHQSLNYLLEQMSITITQTSYTDSVQVDCLVDTSQVEELKDAVIAQLNGKVTFLLGERSYNEVPL